METHPANADAPSVDVAVVGGGISGLTTARALVMLGRRVRLFEREWRIGGLIRTDVVGDFVVDTGPDTLLTHKPAALDLVRALGLSDRVVEPLACRSTFVLKHGALRSLPETSALGLPVNPWTVVRAGAFSWRGKLRMAAEPFIRRRREDADESIGSFVERRFGREAVASVAEPLMAGIHRGDARRLSLRALFPNLARAEQTVGSVAKAWRRLPRPKGPGVLSLRGGLGEMLDSLGRQLGSGVIATCSAVRSIDRGQGGHGYRVACEDGTRVTATAVVIATPAYVTARLLSPLDPGLASRCASIRYLPALNVALAYRRDEVGHPLTGWGYVVPRAERQRLTSASWVSSKWPGRAPDGAVLIRAAVRAGINDHDVPDRDIADTADEELRRVLRIRGAPLFARVYRHEAAMPQLEVGHLERIAEIDRLLARSPGLFVTASGFRGVGLAECIGDAQRVAAGVAAYLQGPAMYDLAG